MATKEEILAAVTSLDPANDELWTSDGLPRLDAVENLVGSVNRKQVTDAAPEFSRTVAQELANSDPTAPDAAPDDQGTASGDETTVVSDESASTDDTQAPDETSATTDATSVQGDTTDTDADDEFALDAHDYDEAIQAAQDKFDAIQAEIKQLVAERDDAENGIKAAIEAKNQAFPPKTPAQIIRQTQLDSMAQRQKRADTMRALTDALRGSGLKVDGSGAVKSARPTLDDTLKNRDRQSPGLLN